jgi:hypothetical protein
MSYEPRRHRNPVLEEIERNFGFDESLLERDRASDRQRPDRQRSAGVR